MCGIAGFFGDHDLKLLQKMNRTLTHRGPDDEGYYLKPGIGLAMRRLSIIDVASGHQPIANEDQTIWTVFNGEIYNFRELRKELTRLGYHFKTDHSDTETIVHAYEEYGPDFVKKLNGMFAIAVWDAKERKLLLYRDRLGEKPLYFYRHGKEVFFSSEIKGILALPFFKRKVNEQALFYYLGLKHSPREHGFFEGIESLGPGEYLVIQKGKVQRKTYWEIDASKVLKISEAEAASEIKSLLEDSVKLRMVSDVPLGAYLSGGVDSSAVVGLMSRIRKNPVETFSLTYRDALPNKRQDEIAAAEMSKRFKTKHRKYRMSFDEFDTELDDIISAFDEPFGGTISTFFLSKLIKQHVTVAISGDGADELFGSYKAHRLAYPIENLNRLIQKGQDLNHLTQKQLEELRPFDQNVDYLLNIRAKQPYQWHSRLTVYSDEEKRKLFGASINRKTASCSTENYFKSAYAKTKSKDVLNQVLQVECQNLLPDQVLNFVDRLSMAHSIEVRPPFLDHRLVEFAFKLPGSMKIKNGINKYILKKAVNGLLPEKIINRPKEGFILPYIFWMQNYLRSKIRRVLSPRELSKHGYFDAKYVAQLISEYDSGRTEHANKIYLLLMFQLWWKKYIGK